MVDQETNNHDHSSAPSNFWTKHINSPHASWFLAAISFAESVFMPVIIDPFLAGLILANRKRWKWYVFISIAASVAGGLFAYYIGLLFFDTLGVALLSAFGLYEQFWQFSGRVDQGAFVFVLIGALTPVPYKLVALASGFLQIGLVTFIVASTVGRIFRLGLVGAAANLLSPKALPLVKKYHYKAALAVGILLIVYLLFLLISNGG